MDTLKIIGFMVVVAIVALMVFLFFSRTTAPDRAPIRKDFLFATPIPTSTPEPTPAPTSSPAPSPVTIKITSRGFLPSNATVPLGGVVTFVNQDSASHWPASGPHPSHTLCSGFDARRGLRQGESYSLTFTEKKSCSFHDHLRPSLEGMVEVK